jgi:hypothetical protein
MPVCAVIGCRPEEGFTMFQCYACGKILYKQQEIYHRKIRLSETMPYFNVNLCQTCAKKRERIDLLWVIGALVVCAPFVCGGLISLLVQPFNLLVSAYSTDASKTPLGATPSATRGAGGEINPPPAARTGQLELRATVPILEGVDAWVEVDGNRSANWMVNTAEVRVSLPAGLHRVTVRSIYQGVLGTFYDQDVQVAADATTSVHVGP